MTISVKVHVNGHYRAIVEQEGHPTRIIDGNYVGSPNPSGEGQIYLPHPVEKRTITITEEYLGEIKS